MKIGGREIEKIVVSKSDGEFIAEITGEGITKDSGVEVELVSKYSAASTFDLVMELMSREGVVMIGQDRDTISLHIKK